MLELYIAFFVIALILFAGISFYSLRAKKRTSKPKKSGYVEPLFEELQKSKNKQQRTEKVREQPAAKEFEQVDDSNSESNTLPPEQLSETEPVKKQSTAVSNQTTSEKQTTPQEEVITDWVVRIKVDNAVEQKDILGLFRNHDYKFRQKVHIYGLNQLTDLWCDVERELPSSRFVELGVSIQLVSRSGKLSNKEIHDFQQLVFNFSETYDAPFEFSLSIEEAEAQAQHLHKLSRRFNLMAVLNVVPKSKVGFRMADIESCARDLMMVTDKNGFFIKKDNGKGAQSVLYTLACADGKGLFGINAGAMTVVHDVVFYLNVPVTANPVAVFDLMLEDAHKLAAWLDGRLVDQNNKVMAAQVFDKLRNEIAEVSESMLRCGIEAGSPMTRKIF